MSRFSSILFSALIGLSILSAPKAQAAVSEPSGPFGIGIILGEPTGFTLKYNLDAHSAIDGGVSFRFDRYFMLYGDWHYRFAGVLPNKNFLNQLTPYVGVGGVMLISNDDKYHYFDEDWNDDDFALGIRIPLGIEWRAPKVPIGVFVEIVPGLAIVPGTDAFFQGGVGARWFFK